MIGAAFLMATSAIGPGFLTQTSIFTQQLKASFGFVIIVTIVIDIAVQLNIWRILTVSGLRAQDLSNKIVPGLGYVLAVFIFIGGIAFNVGNIAGCGLGVHVLTGLDNGYGAVLSCIVALFIFWLKEAGHVLDNFTKILGLIMILVTLYIAVSSHPPVIEAMVKTVFPDTVNTDAIITLVGGTVGGYISFAGAHRLIDAGYTGREQLQAVNHSAVEGIAVTALMRVILFLASLGVVWKAGTLDLSNPAASVFKIAAGQIGYRFFGVVMWCASITSVVGAAYTSVSFLKTLHRNIDKHQRIFVTLLIICSTGIFLFFNQPVALLLMAGALNGLVLPFSLTVILIASHRTSITKNYRHPRWLMFLGWIVVAVMTALSIQLIKNWIG